MCCDGHLMVTWWSHDVLWWSPDGHMMVTWCVVIVTWWSHDVLWWSHDGHLTLGSSYQRQEWSPEESFCWQNANPAAKVGPEWIFFSRLLCTEVRELFMFVAIYVHIFPSLLPHIVSPTCESLYSLSMSNCNWVDKNWQKVVRNHFLPMSSS